MWTQFLLIGLCGTGVIWASQRKWPFIVRAALSVLFVVIAVIGTYFTAEPPTLGPDDPWVNRSPAREIALFLIMLVGMAARYLAKAIEVRRERMEADRKTTKRSSRPKLEFDIWELTYPLLFSVVTFGALLGQMQQTTLTLANLVLSFETGFFWQTILARKSSSSTA